MAPTKRLNIGVAGLGAMGFGIARHLVDSGYHVTGFDVSQPSLERFRAVGGSIASSPKGTAEGSDVFICMVANSQQVQSVLFGGENGAAQALPLDATILICSTCPAAYLEELQSNLTAAGRTDISLIDGPVSGGTMRAAEGTLTVLASGTQTSLKKGTEVLAEMAEKLYIIPGGIGAASNVKMINQLLAGIHICAAAEAMGLAARAGLNTQEVYNIIVNAAGNSWMFENRVPHMLNDDWTPHSALDIFVKDMGIVTSMARLHGFPLPLSSAAEQLYIAASSHGYGRDDDSGIVRLFNPKSISAVHTQAVKVPNGISTTTSPPLEIYKIGFVGLGAMGQGMATSLVKADFPVCGYDVSPPSIQRFVDAGGKSTGAASPVDAALEAQVLILMVQNAKQVEDVLFGAGKGAETLPHGAVIILSSTVPPSFVKKLRERLVDLRKNLDLVDAPVSGGVTRAASGNLTIISSGSNSALSKVSAVLAAMSGPAKNLYRVHGGVGAASSVKLINQLLAGVHIAAAAEAMAFGAKLGIDTESLYDIIRNAAGNSWMFQDRVPAMLKADWTPRSALAIFVKDLGIVLDEAKMLSYPATLSATAHQLYLFGASNGWSKDADAGVVRIWEQMTGHVVSKRNKSSGKLPFEPREYPTLPVKKKIGSLPPEYVGNIIDTVQERVGNKNTPVLVVLDDDPTGTQTCHDIAVLTIWDHDTLLSEFLKTEKGFFILTNSRALSPTEARKTISIIAQNVAQAAKEAGKKFEIVLRGDSTLRGHFPDEPEVIEETIGKFDGWVLAPFFFQGGRYTIDDVHYVSEGDVLVPASQTPFAKDATFGYKSSNLRDYVLEKCGEKFTRDDIFSITLEDIRIGGPDKVTERLTEAPKGSVIIVNAAAESDIFVVVAGLLKANDQGLNYLYRTGAAFVSSRLGIVGKPPMSAKDLDIGYGENPAGGLIIAGSYVPKTTAQLKSLRTLRGPKLHTIELDVEKLIAASEEANSTIEAAAHESSDMIRRGKDVLVMTSRKIIVGDNAISSLNIGSIIAAALVKVLQNVEVRPRYVIAKGGITSSDAATKGLNIKRAMILGQAAPGVPLWRCDDPTSRHAGVPYVVFPGNVGTDDTLGDLVERWAIE